MPSSIPDDLLPRLFRASTLAAVLNKHVQYVGLADRRALGLVSINAVLVPIALTGVQVQMYQLGAVISIATAFVTIGLALVSLYPKTVQSKPDHQLDLFHFSEIARMSEEDYIAHMNDALQETSKLANAMLHDLYHMSSVILAPKFFWLKMAYWVFFGGNVLAIVSIVCANW